MLRANVTVDSDVVRIGDVIDNAGTAAQIAIYRAPDLGTTGSLPTAQVLAALRAHQVIGVDTRDIKAISVTRLARTLEGKEIELQVARALEHRNGLGDAANLSLTFDRDVQDVRLEAWNTGAHAAGLGPLRPAQRPLRRQLRNRQRDQQRAPTKLRFTGTAIETVEAAVLARSVERNEILKSSDVITERRPKAEVGSDVAVRDRAVGMQARRQLRAGQALRAADLAKPDLVQRDQNVTLIYESTGLYLTIRGKALENGTEGDVVNVLNLQSQAHGVRRRDRPRPGRDLDRNAAASRRHGSHPPRSEQPNRCAGFGRRQHHAPRCLQKPSNVHVDFQYQPYRCSPAPC